MNATTTATTITAPPDEGGGRCEFAHKSAGTKDTETETEPGDNHPLRRSEEWPHPHGPRHAAAHRQQQPCPTPRARSSAPSVHHDRAPLPSVTALVTVTLVLASFLFSSFAHHDHASYGAAGPEPDHVHADAVYGSNAGRRYHPSESSVVPR